MPAYNGLIGGREAAIKINKKNKSKAEQRRLEREKKLPKDKMGYTIEFNGQF